MIGFYDYTVILTYMSLASSTLGIVLAVEKHPVLAIICLALSGLFDMFDGKVARTKKNRTDDEKMFGVQIDSLCDVICFGFYPGVYCYIAGANSYLAILVMIYYAVAAVIRLAFFNVIEINRQMKEDGENKFYHGLPVTSIAVILPVVYLFKIFVPKIIFPWILVATLFLTGTAFIVDFKFRKPSNRQLGLLVLFVAVVLFISLRGSHVI